VAAKDARLDAKPSSCDAQVVLTAKEHTVSFTGDDFTVYGDDGHVWFK
jgi:hypothetical protein